MPSDSSACLAAFALARERWFVTLGPPRGGGNVRGGRRGGGPARGGPEGRLRHRYRGGGPGAGRDAPPKTRRDAWEFAAKC